MDESHSKPYQVRSKMHYATMVALIISNVTVLGLAFLFNYALMSEPLGQIAFDGELTRLRAQASADRINERREAPRQKGGRGSGGSVSRPFIGSPLGMYNGQTDPLETLALLTKGGVNLYHTQRLWEQIEPTAGEIDVVGQFATLDTITTNFPQFDGIVIVPKMIDTNVRSLPSDIDQLQFSSQQVINRYKNLINEIAAVPFANSIDYFLIGNEVDAYLSDHPEELNHFAFFYQQAVSHVRTVLPHAKVGTIMTVKGVQQHPEIFDVLEPYGDIIVYTYYPFTSGGAHGVAMKSVDDAMADINFAIQRAEGRLFAFTEIGYTAGVTNNSSDEQQAEFVRRMFVTLDNVRKNGSLEFLHYMTTFDPPPEFNEAYANQQGVNSPGFLAFMNDLGLIEYDTGVERVGWSDFVLGMQTWRQGLELPLDWFPVSGESPSLRGLQ